MADPPRIITRRLGIASIVNATSLDDLLAWVRTTVAYFDNGGAKEISVELLQEQTPDTRPGTTTMYWRPWQGRIRATWPDSSEPAVAPQERLAHSIAEKILARVGDRMGEMYDAIPDLIHDVHPPYRTMPREERVALVQAVAEQIGGRGYVHTGPVP